MSQSLPRYVTDELERLSAPNDEPASIPSGGLSVGSAYLVIPDLGAVRHWELGAALAPGDSITITLHLTLSCEAAEAAPAASPSA